jgi:type II secretory pathway component GspD/PulD (secretin)
MVLVSGGLVFRKLDEYYLVGAPDPANPNFYLLSETEVLKLKYLDGQALAAYLAGPCGKYVTLEGGPTLEPERERDRARTTTTYSRQTAGPATLAGTRLFITAPRDMIQRIRADLAQIDRPRTQVMLEAVVMEVSEDVLKEVGIDWATRWIRFASRAMATAAGNGAGSGTTTGQSADTFPQSSLTYSELSFAETAQLTALIETGKAKLRANPRVATIEGQVAEIEVGQEKYFAIVTGPVTFPYTTLEQIPSGITLRILPRVIEETGEIIARIEPDVRDVTGKGPNGLPEITFRRALTTLRVKDGQSIVIGGLTNEFTTRTVSKLPLLGDLPLLGYLFRHTTSRQQKTEVVIIITPHILGEDGTYAGQPAPLGQVPAGPAR